MEQSEEKGMEMVRLQTLIITPLKRSPTLHSENEYCRAGFGLVWFGLVWFGLVWFGLVWFGLV